MVRAGKGNGSGKRLSELGETWAGVQQSYHLFRFAFSQLRLLIGKEVRLFLKTFYLGDC